jgi:hypothetical protein
MDDKSKGRRGQDPQSGDLHCTVRAYTAPAIVTPNVNLMGNFSSFQKHFQKHRVRDIRYLSRLYDLQAIYPAGSKPLAFAVVVCIYIYISVLLC